MYIYKITNNVNGKIYIGQTIHPVSDRFIQHKKNALRGSTYYLYRAIRKYGFENFSIETIDTAKTIEELNYLEKFYIAKFDAMNPNIGYNMCEGGDSNIMFSPIVKKHHADKLKDPTVRKKISDSMKEYRKSHPFTDEHRKRLSESMMGNHNFGSGDTRSIPCYCIDESGVKHSFHSIKDATVWWFDNYKPFGDRYILITLQRKIRKSINENISFGVQWYVETCV